MALANKYKNNVTRTLYYRYLKFKMPHAYAADRESWEKEVDDLWISSEECASHIGLDCEGSRDVWLYRLRSDQCLAK